MTEMRPLSDDRKEELKGLAIYAFLPEHALWSKRHGLGAIGFTVLFGASVTFLVIAFFGTQHRPDALWSSLGLATSIVGVMHHLRGIRRVFQHVQQHDITMREVPDE